MTDTQEQALQNNSRLLRTILNLPNYTFFHSLKRTLDSVLNNGINLFQKITQPQPQSQQPQNQPQDRPKVHIKYSFQNYAQNTPLGEEETLQKPNNKGSKTIANISEQLEASKLSQEQFSFEMRLKKGSKLVKRDLSESSTERALPTLRGVSKEEKQFFEEINFSIFAEMHKNLAEVRRKESLKIIDDSGYSNADYLKYALRVNSLSAPSQSTIDDRLELRNDLRRDRRTLRKKILFEQDESQQLYDIGKVREVFNSELLRRQHQRRLLAQQRRREEEEHERRKLELERQQQKRIEQLKRQQEFVLMQRKLTEEKRLQEQRAQEEKRLLAAQEFQRQLNDEMRVQVAESAQKSPLKQDSPPPLLAEVVPLKKKSQEKLAGESFLGTPSKSNIEKLQSQQSQQSQSNQPLPQSSQHPQQQLSSNPFINQPTRQLGLKDLINSSSTDSSSFFKSVPIAASPVKANIFNTNTQTPVNNLFTNSNQPQPQPQSHLNLQPQSQPFSSFLGTSPMKNTPSANININNSPYNSIPQGIYFNNSMQGGFPNGSNNQNLGSNFSSSGSSSGPSGGMIPVFPSVVPSANKNLFMNTPQSTVSLFGGTTSSNTNNSTNSRGNRGGKKAIRVQ